MMHYNFDEIIPRENTYCLKYDDRLNRFGRTDVLPLWVADMDFRICNKITDRFKEIVDHGIYGYHLRTTDYYEAVIKWLQSQFQLKCHSREIFFTPGVVPAISYLIQAFTSEGDGIVIQSPVYYPFFSLVKQNNRKLLINQLVEKDRNYTIDFDDFEEKIKQARMFILCSPHNPVGRVWTMDELKKMAEICLKYNVLIVSDEIHADLVRTGYQHIPIASLNKDISQITVTCHSPSKTFNLAGLSVGYVVIKNIKLIDAFKKYFSNLHVEALNTFAYEGLRVAYNTCIDWKTEMWQYVENNYQFLLDFITKNIPEVKVTPLQATYLVWLDFRLLQLNDIKLKKLIIEKAGLGLNDGPTFGPGGSGFQRINLACPRAILNEALSRLKYAIKRL